MATTQIALLRGINVGCAKRVAMADLRTLLTNLRYGDVRTLLNSGNVVFTSPRANTKDAATRIEKAIAERLGVSARVIVVTAAQLNRVVAENPFARIANDPSRYLIGFLANPADRSKLESLCEQTWKPDALALGDGVAYIWCAGGILESQLLEAVGRALKGGLTTRNWATVMKLNALAQ